MHRRTHVCLRCQRSYRRDPAERDVACPICHDVCESVHSKIRIPSPKRARQWRIFWEKYRAEKRLLRRFLDDPSIKELELDLLNQRWIRR